MDISEFNKDNSKSVVLKSAVPESAKSEACMMGIDEAGRGPVLGPMVYGTCYCPVTYKDKLKESGVADSKTLTEADREQLFSNIDQDKENLGWLIHVLSPMHISNCMLRRDKFNLNSLSHETAMGLIQGVLDLGVNLEEVYVDTVGDPGKYQEKLAARFPQLLISVAKKADSLYPVVSAASICAKVARDLAVTQWTFPEGLHLPDDVTTGSGYPADPQTKNFMAACCDKVFGYTSFVRFSWSTADVLLRKNCVPVAWDDDEENDENAKSAAKKKKAMADAAKGTPSINSFFTKAGPVRGVTKAKKAAERHAFFKDRLLKRVTQIRVKE